MSSDLHMSSDYNSNSACQSLGAATLATFLRREAARIDASLAAEEALQVVEYGCATGGSSLVPLGAIQDSISDRPLRATMNDLPRNNWATLSSTVEPALPEIDLQGALPRPRRRRVCRPAAGWAARGPAPRRHRRR